MLAGYIDAVRASLPRAQLVSECFHIAQHRNRAVTPCAGKPGAP